MPMPSLVLLQRMDPVSVYLACGDKDELVAKLYDDMPVDSILEVAAELPHMGHALAQAMEALKGTTCEDGWFDMPTGVALQRIGACFGNTKPHDLSKKPILTKLNKEDRVLIQAALREAKTVGKAEMCQEDRQLLQQVLRRLDVVAKMCRDTQDNVLRLQKSVWDNAMELRALKISCTPQPPQKQTREEFLAEIDAEFAWAFPNGFCTEEPQCHEPVAKPKQEEMSTAGAQQDEMTKTMPQQEEIPHVEPQQPRQQDEWPDFEPEEVEEWPVEPQCHKPVAKPKADEMGMAGAQQDEVTKIMPQQKESTSVEPQQPRQQTEWPDFEPEEVEEWPIEQQCHEPVATPKQEETSMAGARQQEVAKRMPRQDEINCVEPQHCHDLATNAEQVEWRPCVAIEKQYDDLSDLSSVDGNESPPHKQVKEYAAARRAARKQIVVGTSTVEPTEVGDGPARPIAPTEPKPTEQMPTQMTNLSAELVPCTRQEAETATYIRQTLRQKLGNEAAEAILAQCQQKVVRSHTGKLQRYWVDVTGATLRLAPQKNVTP